MSLPRAPIETQRLRLEPLDPSHLELVMVAIDVSRPELRPWMPWGDIDRTGEAEFLRAAAVAWDEGRLYAFAVLSGGVVLGTAGLHLSQHVRWTGELGYWIRSDQAGKGYATEACRAVIDLGFDTFGLQRIELLAGIRNTASQRVAHKLGFRREGVARGAAFGGNGIYDCIAYGLLPDDRVPSEPAPASSSDPPAPDFSRGLISAVAQDESDGTVLMLAHMDEEAYRRTLETGHAWFWSRSRGTLWEKGSTSGNYLDVVSVSVDCDGDAVLLRVHPHGPACHTGERSCFHGTVRG